MSKKRKPVKPPAAQPAVKVPPRDTRADGNPWFGTADTLNDTPSQKAGDIGAGLSAPGLSDAKPKAELAPADAFVQAVISGDHDQIKETYSKLSLSDGQKIKASFIAMPQEQRDAVVKNVTANKDLFNPLAYSQFNFMMQTAPPPPKDAKPLNFEPVALEGQDALASMGGAAKLPAGYTTPKITDISGEAKFAGLHPLEQVNGFVIHHTGPGMTSAADVMNVFKQRDFPAQFVIDRDGSIFQTLPAGSTGRQIEGTSKKDKAGNPVYPSVKDMGLSNANTIGVEIMAADDKDVKPAQVAAAKQLFQYLSADPAAAAWKATGITADQVYGHGVLNPGRKEATEGATAVAAIKASFAGGARLAAAAAPVQATAGQLDHMTRVVLAEARGEGDQGMAGVAAVIKNRALAGVAGGDISAVLSQPDQFAAPLKSGYTAAEYQNAQKIAQGVLDGSIADPTNGATYFANPKTSDPRALKQITDAAQPLATIGSHVFYGTPGAVPALANAEIAGGSGQDTVAGSARSVAGRDVVARAIQATGGIGKGSRNTAANKAVQGALSTLAVGDRIGAPLTVDGVFGNRTKEAVKNFQAREGLKPDGVVGSATLGKINDRLTEANFGGAVGTEGSPELAGQVAPTRTRDFAAGAAAAAVTVDPNVSGSFGRSTTATLSAAVNHPDTFVSSDKEWDPAAARIAGILRDNAAMDAQAKAAVAKAGKTPFAPPIEGSAVVPQTLEQYLGGGPGTGPGKQHQFPAEQGLGADVRGVWDSAQKAFDIEHWLQEPTVQDSGSGTGTFGTTALASDPYRPTGGYEPGGSNGDGGFDSFAAGMASTYTTVGGGGSVFGGSTGGGGGTVYSGVTPTTYQDSGNPAGNDYSNVGGIP